MDDFYLQFPRGLEVEDSFMLIKNMEINLTSSAGSVSDSFAYTSPARYESTLLLSECLSPWTYFASFFFLV